MNYYDELGVSPKATPEEIRQAYKTLARLLHPDNQSDEKMRLTAERQMKRLNEIFGMLLDPVKRREYDEGLYRAEARTGPPQPMNMGPPMPRPMPPMPPPGLQSRWLQLALQNWFWIFICAVLVGSTTWFFLASGPPAPPVREAAAREPQPSEAAKDAGDTRPAAAKSAGSQSAVTSQSSERKAPVSARLGIPAPAAPPAPSAPAVSPNKPSPFTVPAAPALAQPSEAAPNPSDTPAAEPVPAPVITPVPTPAPAPPVPAPVHTIERAAEQPRPVPPAQEQVTPPAPVIQAALPKPDANNYSFAGDWFFNPQNSAPPKPGFYPPEYIEFSIVEREGMLSGKYKARFKVNDRLIPPDVLIAIRGKTSGGNSVLLPWSSADGAKGEMELLLKSPNSLNVNWWTTQFGRRSALSSGTSLLIRQQTR